MRLENKIGIVTAMASGMGRAGGEDKEALIVRRSQQIPMRRTGRSEEIANAVLFLLSDEASFVSGAALPVDGAATA